MRRVLNNSDLRIDRKTYYNLIRGKLFNEYSSDSFEGLVLALEEVGFKFACLMSDGLADNNSTQGRMLERVFFFTNRQIVYTKRFIASQILLTDGTFKTSRLQVQARTSLGVQFR
jgi:hypothetical protein